MFFLLDIVGLLQRYMLTCPSKYFLRIDCPGCGIQRSFIALVSGDVRLSLQMYPALMPILFVLFYTALHLKKDFKHGARNIKILQLLAATIILCFYIYKILNHKLTA